jgi:hypothetical protein
VAVVHLACITVVHGFPNEKNGQHEIVRYDHLIPRIYFSRSVYVVVHFCSGLIN